MTVQAALDVVVIKACAALLLALVATAAGRWLRRPALLHALWIVVLLELLVPPLFEIGVLPRAGTAQPQAARTARTAPLLSIPGGAIVAEIPPVPAASVLLPGLAAVWFLGGAGLLLLTAARVRRFGRLLSDAADAPREMCDAGRQLARRLGLSRCPRIRLVPAAISPMLRPRWGSLEVLFPSALLERLGRGERDALLAHELAHVRRRDHWVRWLELAAGTLFWWHPVVWWARSRLRRVEEQCCDGLVLDTLPDHSSDYARGLVKTVEFLAGDRAGLPALASGIGEARNLEERLTMIVQRRLPKKLSRIQQLALAAAAGSLLLVLPTWADRAPGEEAEARENMLELERQAAALEAELHEVRARQRALELKLKQQQEQIEFRRLEVEAAESEAAGDREAVERFRRQQEWMREQIALEAERDRFETERMRAMTELEDPLRRAMLEAEAASQRGDRERAAEFEARAVEMKIRLEQLARSTHIRQEELDQRMNAMMLDRMREEILLLRRQGRDREASEMARELDALLGDLELQRTLRLREDELREVRRQLELVERELDRAETEGLDCEAEALRGHADELRDHLRRLESGIR